MARAQTALAARVAAPASAFPPALQRAAAAAPAVSRGYTSWEGVVNSTVGNSQRAEANAAVVQSLRRQLHEGGRAAGAAAAPVAERRSAASHPQPPPPPPLTACLCCLGPQEAYMGEHQHQQQQRALSEPFARQEAARLAMAEALFSS